MRFGSFTIYIYKYLRGCLASWKNAVFAARTTGCLWFPAQRQDRLHDSGLVTQSHISHGDNDTHPIQIRMRIVYAESPARADGTRGT